jgi:hypothetical protein
MEWFDLCLDWFFEENPEKCKILTITPNIAKSVMVAEMKVGLPPLNGVVQPVSRQVF